MANKKALLVETLNRKEVNHTHMPDLKNGKLEASQVQEISANRFRIETVRKGVDGNPDDKIIAEYCVWTDKEAKEYDWVPEKSGIPTSDEKYRVYRLI